MTYKHIKFDESAVMRSLQKQAIEKGIIKPKEIVKEASKQSSIYISDNLDENLSNLISGLKKAGMEDLASEISYKFIDYKKAESKLYGLKNGSDAEDLVNEAHPKGSYDLKDVEGDSTIEYLYDQHKKMMDVVKKKINKSAQLNPVGVVHSVLTNANTNIRNIFSKIDEVLEKKLSSEDLIDNKNVKIKNKILNKINAFKYQIQIFAKSSKMLLSEASNHGINILIDFLKNFESDDSVRFLGGEYINQTKNIINNSINSLNSYKERHLDSSQNVKENEYNYNEKEITDPNYKINVESNAFKNANNLILELRNKLEEYEDEDVVDLKKWLNEKNGLLFNIKRNFQDHGEKGLKGLDRLISSLESAKQKWSNL